MGEAKRKLLMVGDRTLMIHNADREDETWEGDHATYNVTRGRALVKDTLPYLEDLSKVYEKNGHLEVDHAYAASLDMRRLNEPLLMVEEDDGKVYLIDGRHRLEERHRRGMTTVLLLIVPKELRPQIEVSYSVFEHGRRVLFSRHMQEVITFMEARR
jgi:hypothetical protein